MKKCITQDLQSKVAYTNSYLVTKTWRLLWNFISRKDLLGEGIATWGLLCPMTMKQEGGMKHEGKPEGGAWQSFQAWWLF